MNDAAPIPEAEGLIAALGGRSIVLIGMMGAGKTSVGKRLAQKLGLPFIDADDEIEAGAQMTIPEIFERFGEPYFRDGERRVIARLLEDGPKVLSTGGGAFLNQETRRRVAERGVSVWLKPEFETLLRRVRKRSNRPLLRTDDPEATLRKLLEDRSPTYALADLTIETRDGPHDAVVETLIGALRRRLAHPASPTTREVAVDLGPRAYRILIGPGLIESAGAHVAALAPGARCAIVTDATVAKLHLEPLRKSLEAAGLTTSVVVCPPGEGTKSYAEFARVSDALIEARVERRDLVVALGGGVIGDLAGFCAATLRRGVRFVQIPTTLLAQVDSSVGGKTAINSPLGKNLVGAFHQPSLVLADTGVLDTLNAREFRAGYAEVAKYGLIGDRDFFAGSNATGARCSPAGRRGWRRSRRAAPPRRASSPPTRPSGASAPCSILAIRSATRSSASPITTARCWFTARAWRLAWPARSAFRATSACARPATFAGSKAISPALACRAAFPPCAASTPTRRRSSMRCARTRRSSVAA